MNKTVIVGDTDESLCFFAKQFDTSAKHYSSQTKNHPMVYASIGDITLDEFLEILVNADNIVYHNKSGDWSSSQTKRLTEHIMYLLYINGYSNKITGFPAEAFVMDDNPLHVHLISPDIARHHVIKKICNFSEINFQGLVAHRKSLSTQIWIAGCSYAYGTGLENQSLRYGDLIGKKLKMPVTNLSLAGSSIDFSADQIIRSFLKKDDVIVWGLTGIGRYTWFFQNCFETILPSYIKTLTDDRKKFLTDMYLDDARFYLAQRHITQVQHVCEKVGCHLVLLYHESLSLPDQISPMKEFLTQFPGFIDINQLMLEKFGSTVLDKKYNLDIGSDNMHPGKRTHSEWAQMIVDFVQKKNYLDHHD